MNARYTTLTSRNKAMVSVAVVLCAAKDNIRLKSWADSDAESDKWDRKDHDGRVKQTIIDIADIDPPPNKPFINIAVGKDAFARAFDDLSINPPITWAIRWDMVLELADRDPMAENQKYVLLVALAQLLRAARDNFSTTPWVDDDDLDDDDDP